MFLLIILLAAAGVYVEAKIVKSVPTVGRYLERYRLLSLAFSLILSVLLGSLFGAAGLIVFAAGLLSTIMIQPWYVMRASGTMERLAKSCDSHKEEVIYRLDQLAKLAVLLFKIAVFPIVIFFKILDAVETVTNKMTRGVR